MLLVSGRHRASPILALTSALQLPENISYLLSLHESAAYFFFSMEKKISTFRLTGGMRSILPSLISVSCILVAEHLL